MFKQPMRKSNQEIIDPVEIEEILKNGRVCRLAMCKNNSPYIVPLNYGYDNGYLYFHCAEEGLKIEILKENPHVCFEIETDLHLKSNDEPCTWSQYYKSIIGFGRAHFLKYREEKLKALLILMNHYRAQDWKIPDVKIDGVTIIEVKIDSITGKKKGIDGCNIYFNK